MNPDWPCKLEVTGFPFYDWGWNGTFVMTAKSAYGKPVYYHKRHSYYGISIIGLYLMRWSDDTWRFIINGCPTPLDEFSCRCENPWEDQWENGIKVTQMKSVGLSSIDGIQWPTQLRVSGFPLLYRSWNGDYQLTVEINDFCPIYWSKSCRLMRMGSKWCFYNGDDIKFSNNELFPWIGEWKGGELTVIPV